MIQRTLAFVRVGISSSTQHILGKIKSALEYRIQKNFRTSHFQITAKWNILNGFNFECLARPPCENLRCPDALKYVLC